MSEGARIDVSRFDDTNGPAVFELWLAQNPAPVGVPLQYDENGQRYVFLWRRIGRIYHLYVRVHASFELLEAGGEFETEFFLFFPAARRVLYERTASRTEPGGAMARVTPNPAVYDIETIMADPERWLVSDE